ncbi:MAG: ATP-binding protein [Acidobacteriales bacterium]|nr:ATP-binding protein [Terriglobales bacterium]
MGTPIPADEQERLASLRKYKILDTDPEQSFDDLTHLAAFICGTPIALITLIDSERQWFKSRFGVEVQETPRSLAFCAHAIMSREIFVVEDARKDERFKDNPFVAAENGMRFYAGAPFCSGSGHALGTICVVDHKPRKLTQEQREALDALRRVVERQLEFRANLIELKSALAQRDTLEEQREGLVTGLQEQLNNVKRLAGLLPESGSCKFTLTIPAKTSAITPVVEGVLETVRQMKAAEGREFELEMALREALANAIVHGCKNDETKHVQCSVACEPSGDVLMVIRDPGEGFDPASVPDCRDGENIKQTHGRGVYLINSLVDAAEIVTPQNDPKMVGTEVRMRVSGTNGH